MPGLLLRTALIAIATGLAVLPASAPGPAAAAEFVRTDTGQAVSPEHLLLTLAQSGVVARLSTGESVSILDAQITAQAPTALYLAISSEARIAAVLEGEAALSNNGQAVNIGEAAVWPIARGNAMVTAFDIDRFLATSSLALPASTRASLQAAAEDQRDGLFWGALKRTGTNAQSPVPPMVEAMRRDILLRPSVVSLRHDAGSDREAMARMTVDSFIAAVRTRDISTVRDLMAPSLFRPDERTPSAWLTVRHDLAVAMIDSPLGQALASAEVVGGDLESGFQAQLATGESLHITMLNEHGFTFIGTIGPEGEQ